MAWETLPEPTGNIGNDCGKKWQIENLSEVEEMPVQLQNALGGNGWSQDGP